MENATRKTVVSQVYMYDNFNNCLFTGLLFGQINVEAEAQYDTKLAVKTVGGEMGYSKAGQRKEIQMKQDKLNKAFSLLVS